MEPSSSEVEVDHLFIGWADLNIPSEQPCVQKLTMPVEIEAELNQLELFSEGGRESMTIQVIAHYLFLVLWAHWVQNGQRLPASLISSNMWW